VCRTPYRIRPLGGGRERIGGTKLRDCPRTGGGGGHDEREENPGVNYRSTLVGVEESSGGAGSMPPIA